MSADGVDTDDKDSSFYAIVFNTYSFISIASSITHFILNVLFMIQLYKNNEMILFGIGIVIFMIAKFVLFWCFRMQHFRRRRTKGYEGECNLSYFCCGCDARYLWIIHFCFAIPFCSLLCYLDYEMGIISDIFEYFECNSHHQKLHINNQNEKDKLLQRMDELIQSHRLYKIECIIFNIPFIMIQWIFILNNGYTHKSFIGFIIGIFVIKWKLLLFNIRSYNICCILFHWICFNVDLLIFIINILWIYHIIINYNISLFPLIIILFIAMFTRIILISIPEAFKYCKENIYIPLKRSLMSNNYATTLNAPYYRYVRSINDLPNIALYPRCLIATPRRGHTEHNNNIYENSNQSKLNKPANIYEKLFIVLLFSIYIPFIFLLHIIMNYIPCYSYILYYVEIFDYDYSMNKAGLQRLFWKWLNYSIPNLSKYAQKHSKNGLFYCLYCTYYFYTHFVKSINAENKKQSLQYMNIHRRLMIINYVLPTKNNGVNIRNAEIFDYDRFELNDLINDAFQSRNDGERINYIDYRSDFLKFIDKRKAYKEIKGFDDDKYKKMKRYLVIIGITLFISNILFPFICLCLNGVTVSENVFYFYHLFLCDSYRNVVNVFEEISESTNYDIFILVI